MGCGSPQDVSGVLGERDSAEQRAPLPVYHSPRDISVHRPDTVAHCLRAGEFHNEQVLGIQMSLRVCRE